MTTYQFQDKAPNIDGLVKKMQMVGYRFVHWEFSCEDLCLPTDVEWNYKDLVHVNHVHSHMSRHFFFTGKNIYTTIDLQKFMGVTIPQSAVFYTTEENRLIAHTTLFFFLIFVEVQFEQIGKMKTRTRTSYAVGTRSRLLGLLIPLIRAATRRNWNLFSKDDRPLRSRRGELRQKGFSFVDYSPIDHRATLEIGDNGVIPPIDLPDECSYEFTVNDYQGQTVLVGDADHLGLQICFDHSAIRIFPRLCPHRGAALDVAGPIGSFIKCPWHGRQISPLALILLNGSAQVFDGPLHWCDYDGKKLVVRTKCGKGMAESIDWLAPWNSSGPSIDADIVV